MFTLKHLVVLFILQNTVSSQGDSDYNNDCSDSIEALIGSDSTEYNGGDDDWESSEETINYNSKRKSTKNPEKYTTEKPENNTNEDPKNFCPEHHSWISFEDIKHSIEDNAEILKIKQNFENASYPKTKELFKKYMDEIKDFVDGIIDKPDHMQHILYNMALLRKKLVPDVEKLVSELELFNIVEDKMKNVAISSENKIQELEKYKMICQMYCPTIDIRNQFNSPIISQSAGKYCTTLKDLNNLINKKLSEVQEQHDDSLNQQLEDRKKNYTQQILEFKTNLKNAAVKEFGMLMYDILSLQDDYHHLVKYLEEVNVSSEIKNIEKNIAEIDFRLRSLDLKKYRESCFKCISNRRIKRNVLDFLDGNTSYDVQERFDLPNNVLPAVETVVTDLIKDKIDAIKESIKSNLTTMFEELDRTLNDSKVVDNFVSQLHEIRGGIEGNVKLEQEALKELKSRVAEESIGKILAVSKQSLEILQTLETAKQFIADHFTSMNYV